ncbi:hypothetical protein [Calidifontibacter terrae]
MTADSDAPYAFDGVADHLARLREVRLHLSPNGELVAWSDDEIAAQVRRKGVPMTRAYVQQLSSGSTANPTAQKLLGLALAFDVSPIYFFSAAARRRINRQLDADLEQLRKQVLFGDAQAGEDQH